MFASGNLALEGFGIWFEEFGIWFEECTRGVDNGGVNGKRFLAAWVRCHGVTRADGAGVVHPEDDGGEVACQHQRLLTKEGGWGHGAEN